MEPEANNTITIDRDEYYCLVNLSERRRQAIREAFDSFERLKKLNIKIDLSHKPTSTWEKLQFNGKLVSELTSILSDEEKQQAIAQALGKFTDKEYLHELQTLAQDE